jgi:hypothetical protein
MAICRASITIRNRLLLTQEVHEVKSTLKLPKNYDHRKLNKSVNPKSLANKFVSRKCHFAMTQAFLGQADSTGAL